MLRETILGLVLLVVVLPAAAQQEARPLSDALASGNATSVVLFNPANIQSVAQLDGMAATSAIGVLAVCVGTGCTAAVTGSIARERGWPFELAYADVAQAELGVGTAAVPSVVDRAPRGVLATMSKLSLPSAQAAPAAPNRGMNASFSAPKLPQFLSARGFLLISLPLLLLGIGGAALYLGSRRREDVEEDEFVEDEEVERYIREKHGRKRPPVPMP